MKGKIEIDIKQTREQGPDESGATWRGGGSDGSRGQMGGKGGHMGSQTGELEGPDRGGAPIWYPIPEKSTPLPSQD